MFPDVNIDTLLYPTPVAPPSWMSAGSSAWSMGPASESPLKRSWEPWGRFVVVSIASATGL
jgi:hypothetical protein